MATYQYIARTPAGERVQGMLTADSESAALRHLDERQLFPVQVTPTAEPRAAVIGKRIPARAVGAAYGQLADLLSSGVPLMRALETLQRVSSHARLKKVIEKVHAEVADGSTLADAMAAHPQAFTPLHTAMLRAGERGGFVEQVLENLAAFVERQEELRASIKMAMLYPSLLTLVGVSVLMAALLVFVPMFEPLFGNMELPAPTLMLFALSSLLRNYFPLLLVLLVFAGSMGVMAVRGERGSRLKEAAVLRLPIVGDAVKMVAVTRFCRILGTMLHNGVPLLTALQIARDAAGSRALASAIEAASENVRAGEGLTEPLRQAEMIPTEVLEMIAVAEESNQLEKVLVSIADKIETRTNRKIDQVVALIGPIVLVLIAAIVGFVAVGLLYPIFTMSEAMAG